MISATYRRDVSGEGCQQDRNASGGVMSARYRCQTGRDFSRIEMSDEEGYQRDRDVRGVGISARKRDQRGEGSQRDRNIKEEGLSAG